MDLTAAETKPWWRSTLVVRQSFSLTLTIDDDDAVSFTLTENYFSRPTLMISYISTFFHMFVWKLLVYFWGKGKFGMIHFWKFLWSLNVLCGCSFEFLVEWSYVVSSWTLIDRNLNYLQKRVTNFKSKIVLVNEYNYRTNFILCFKHRSC